MKVVYVAGPFRGNSAWDIECNIRRAETLALEVWRMRGDDDKPLAAALCPHTNTRFFQNAAPDDVWLDGDLELLARCDAVLMTPDWQRSSGARAEYDFAKSKSIPVFFDTDSLLVWLRGGDVLCRLCSDYVGFSEPQVCGRCIVQAM